MKRIMLLLCFIMLCGIATAQTPFKGFFKPVPDNYIRVRAIGTHAWLFRPTVTLTAMQFNLTKPVEVASLTSLGTGISYAHFIDNEGTAYNNFSVNALLLFNQDLINGSIEPVKLSIALTASAFQFVSVGAGYNIAAKQFFILTGVVYNFN